MTSVVRQTRSVSIRKMELLSAELRLLKGAIEQVHGRFELLLAEVSDLEREHKVDIGECTGEHEPDGADEARVDEKPDTLLCQKIPDAAAQPTTTLDSPSPRDCAAASAAEHQPVALLNCADPFASTAGTDTGLISPPEPTYVRLVDDAQSASPRASTIEAIPACESDEAVPAMTAAAEQQAVSGNTDHSVETPQPPTAAPCDIIILSEHRETVSQTRKRPRAIGRWAAAVALLAITLGFAAGQKMPFGPEIQRVAERQLGGLLSALPF